MLHWERRVYKDFKETDSIIFSRLMLTCWTGGREHFNIGFQFQAAAVERWRQQVLKKREKEIVQAVRVQQFVSINGQEKRSISPGIVNFFWHLSGEYASFLFQKIMLSTFQFKHENFAVSTQVLILNFGSGCGGWWGGL